MRKVYMVRGSEDGLLGVYSSRSKAARCAVEYIHTSWEGPATEETRLAIRSQWTQGDTTFYSHKQEGIGVELEAFIVE